MAHNILSQCDDALLVYLNQYSETANIYVAKRASDKDLPHVLCHSQRWTLLDPHQAIYMVQAQVLVKTNAALDVDETEGATSDPSGELVISIMDQFFLGEEGQQNSQLLAEALTQAGRNAGHSNFTVQNVEVKSGDAGFDRQGPVWMDAIDLELVVCPSNVS